MRGEKEKEIFVFCLFYSAHKNDGMDKKHLLQPPSSSGSAGIHQVTSSFLASNFFVIRDLQVIHRVGHEELRPVITLGHVSL